MFQENNNSTFTTLEPSSPSSTSSFSHEYDTSNFFSRLPNETIFAIFAFTFTDRTTEFTTSAANEPDSSTISTVICLTPHKQISILSRVCRLFHNIANDVFIWQNAFEKIFDSEAIIRAGIVENYNNLIKGGVEGVDVVGDTKGEGKTTSQAQPSSSCLIQTQTGGNVWKELYKERQIALNKVKIYVTSTLPSPFASINNVEIDDDITTSIDDLMDDEDDTSTNDEDSSTLESTDHNVDDPLIDFNFVGNQEHEEQNEEKGSSSPNLILGIEDFLFQEFDLRDTTGDTVEKDTIKENNIKIDREDNDIKLDDTCQELDFVGEDSINFDDPELDSIFASNIIEMDQTFNDVKNGKTSTRHIETLVQETDASTIEVDHVFDQNHDLFNSKINDDLDETFLQDYESSELPDYDDENSKLEELKLSDFEEPSSKLPDLEEPSSKLHDLEEPSSNLPDLEEPSSKLPDLEEPSSKLPDLEESSSNLPDLEEPSSNLPDLEEPSSNLLDYKEHHKLPDFEESSSGLKVDEEHHKLPNFEEPSFDLKDYEEDHKLSDFEEPSSNFQDDEPKLLDYDIPSSKLQDPKLPDFEKPLLKLQDYDEELKLPDHEEEPFKLPDYDEDFTLKESFNDELPAYDENEEVFQLQDYNNLQEYDENKKLTNFQDLNNNKTENTSKTPPSNDSSQDFDEIEELNNDTNNEDEGYLGSYNHSYFGFIPVSEEAYADGYINRIPNLRIRANVIRQNNSPRLLKILNTIWKICQENDGMNSEVLLASNVKEFTVNLIQSLNNTTTQIDCLTIALQVLSILMAWHPELAVDLHIMDSFWSNIYASMILTDIFFPESKGDNVRLKQLHLPIPAGSAIHIFFRIKYSNPNRVESIYNFLPPPSLVPNSNIFNNLYQKPGEGMIQPYNGDAYDGKWFGYYSDLQPLPYQYWEGVTRESAMDISLKFSTPEPGKVYKLSDNFFNPGVVVTDKVVKEFSGSGTDQVGEFIIKRGIITEKGNVNFIKIYNTQLRWIYDGVLLPVGICGRWGISKNWEGNFWIWKG
ncbi:9576_t:CDS:2 [Funneliformis geosporum]|uniref:1458_t:CDS:1 n=1 Tax=Funneliformis geosporum TaxID=1117311 RepID=A0A9W4SEE1_9GLOM|nr:9576_t:CDS:2 [Funneliformis geosporum]CAI2166010.1 1458_t:CDS:2 [Funneliformis geosporum]